MTSDPTGSSGASGASSSSDTAAKAARKKRLVKRLLIAGGGLVVVGGLLVLMTPSLLSTGPGKAFIVGKINDQLAGKVEIDDWSLGWFSGIKLSGVKVYDDQKRLAITVGAINTELSILKAARGNYDLGNTVIESPNLVLVELRPDGTNNLSAIVKASDVDVKKVPEGPAQPVKVEGETVVVQVPEVKGNVTIKNLTGAIQGGAIGNSPLRIDPSEIALKIPSLASQPITNDVKLVVYRDGGKKGTITAAGDVQAIFEGKWDGTEGINKIKGNQKIGLTNVDLGAAAPMLASAGLTASGTANGALDVKLPGNGAADAKGEIVLADAAVGGDALKGDTFRSAKIVLPVDVASSAEGGQPLVEIRRFGIESQELTSSVTGKISTTALTNLSMQKKPGSVGNLKAEFRVPDLARVAGQLPHVLALGPGVELRSGTLVALAEVATTADSAKVTGNLSVTNVAGTQAGRPVTLEPITVVYDLSPTFSETGVTAMPVSVDLTSGFANAMAKGALDDLSFSANVSLDRARQQLGQFVDFGALQMAGQLVTSGTLKGDVINGKPATAAVQGELTNVRVSGMEGAQPLDVDRLAFAMRDAKLVKGEAGMVADVPALEVAVGPATAPVMVLSASASGVNTATNEVAAFELKRMEALLPELQRRFGAFVNSPAMEGVTVSSGGVTATVAGSYAGGTLKMSQPLSSQIVGLTVSRQGRPVIANETLTIKANGTVASSPATKLELTALEVTSSSELVSVRQQGEKLLLEVKPDNTMDGAGGVMFAADLARLGQVSAAWSGQQPAQPIRGGRAGGQVNFTADSIKGGVDVNGLTLGNLVQNENVRSTFDVSSKDKFKTVVATANVDSSFAKADVKDARVNLGTTDVWQIVPNAVVEVRSENLAKLDALMKAFSPPSGPATQPSDLPLYATAGTLTAGLNVTSKPGEMIVNIRELKVDGLSLQKGSAGWSLPKPVDFKGQLLVNADSSKGATVMEQIQKVVITELGGSLGVADLSVPQPITLTELGAAPKGQGAITMTGRLQSVTGLLEVLAGVQPGTTYPYIGDFTLTQAFATDANGATAKGGIDITNFRVLPQAGSNSQGFTEPKVSIVNDVTYDLKSTDLEMRAMRIDMPATGALTVDAAGVIRDTAKSRSFAEPLKVKFGYDLEKLVPLVKPMLAAGGQAYLEGGTFQGKYVKEYLISGSYPAGLPMEQAIRGLKASGDFSMDKAVLPAAGVQMTAFAPAVVLDKGVLSLKAQPTGLNGGFMNLDGAVIDLTKADPTITLPANTNLLHQVDLNALLAQRLGRLAFIFANADEAKGRLTLTVNACNSVPMALIAPPPPQVKRNENPLEGLRSFAEKPVAPTTKPLDTPGLLDANIVVTGDFGLAGGPLGKFLNDLPVIKQAASGSLDKCHIMMHDGIATQDVAMRLSIGDVKAQGDVILATEQFRNFTIFVGPAAVGGLLGPLKGIGGLADVPVSIKGTLSKPEWDIGASVGTYLKNNASNLGNLPGDIGKFGGDIGKGLEGLLNRDKEKAAPANPVAPGNQAAPSTQPEKPANPLQGLLQGLGDLEKERERERQERRNRRNTSPEGGTQEPR